MGYLVILLVVTATNVELKDNESTMQAQLRRHHHYNYHHHNHQGCHHHGRHHGHHDGRHHGDCDFSGSMDFSASYVSSNSMSTMTFSTFEGESGLQKERPCRHLTERNQGSFSFSGDSGLSGGIILTLSFEMPDEMVFE